MNQQEHLIRIRAAEPLKKDDCERLAVQIAENLDWTEYKYHFDLDDTVLGGFIVEAGVLKETYFHVFDYSISGRLKRLSKYLKESSDLLKDLSVESLERMLKSEEGSMHTEVGIVKRVGDGIAWVEGLDHCVSNELILFNDDCYGIALNLQEDEIGVILLGNINSVRSGTICTGSGREISVPCGKNLLGRIVNAMGLPIDGGARLKDCQNRPIEQKAAPIISRSGVNEPLYTGITVVDAMIPVGRGQRELIIGDRQTGKTSIAVDTIIRQKNNNVVCIYVAIGQKMTTISSVVRRLKEAGALSYTTIVASPASDAAAMTYIAPYTGCAMAEYLMYEEHKDVLIVYDDLTKHAQAYRAISLLLKRPPGREAYPGDVFYLHAKLLERAAKLSPELGGGSITALPIVETQDGDISAYIPTNVISITDGQIYLESSLFFSGQRPAVNVGLSVSRVGGDAQKKAMKKVAGPLRIQLAQYRELASFAELSSDMDQETREQLSRGVRLNELLKQNNGIEDSRTAAQSICILYLGSKNAFSFLEQKDVRRFVRSYLAYLDLNEKKLVEELEEGKSFTEAHKERIDETLDTFKESWKEMEAVSKDTGLLV